MKTGIGHRKHRDWNENFQILPILSGDDFACGSGDNESKKADIGQCGR